MLNGYYLGLGHLVNRKQDWQKCCMPFCFLNSGNEKAWHGKLQNKMPQEMRELRSDFVANGASPTVGLKHKSYDRQNFLTYVNALTLFFSRCVSLYHKCRRRTICLKYQWRRCAQPFQAAVGRTFFSLKSPFRKQTVFVCFEYFLAKGAGVGQQVATEPSRSYNPPDNQQRPRPPPRCLPSQHVPTNKHVSHSIATSSFFREELNTVWG